MRNHLILIPALLPVSAARAVAYKGLAESVDTEKAREALMK